MNLVRLGHYFTPNHSPGEEVSGSCQTALVVGTDTEFDDWVNLRVWDHDGDDFKRLQVPIVALGASAVDVEGKPEHIGASFHLSADCPWKK